MGNGTEEMSNCELARHSRKSKRLVKAFGQAAAALQQAQYDGYHMIGVPNMKAATAEYKRTRANLLKHMGV